SLGLLAMLILFEESLRRFLRARNPQEKSFRVLMTSWGLIYMIHSAMRLVAPGFIFGLGAAAIDFEPSEQKPAGEMVDDEYP
ncbi:MAG: hypothetical protein ACKOC5_13290, partial [Chloroflexota bacterium]